MSDTAKTQEPIATPAPALTMTEVIVALKPQFQAHACVIVKLMEKHEKKPKDPPVNPANELMRDTLRIAMLCAQKDPTHSIADYMNEIRENHLSFFNCPKLSGIIEQLEQNDPFAGETLEDTQKNLQDYINDKIEFFRRARYETCC